MKKGSLNLSIQAIVILVMAMAILGLGLGFIRTLIGQGQDQFTTAIDNAQLENPASAAQPITVDRSIEVKSGKKSPLRVGFFNTEYTGPFTPSISGCNKFASTDTIQQDVDTGKATGYEILVSTTGSVGTEQVCTIEIKTGSTIVASKQFYAKVVS